MVQYVFLMIPGWKTGQKDRDGLELTLFPIRAGTPSPSGGALLNIFMTKSIQTSGSIKRL
jgi:hypothetical protein